MYFVPYSHHCWLLSRIRKEWVKFLFLISLDDLLYNDVFYMLIWRVFLIIFLSGVEVVTLVFSCQLIGGVMTYALHLIIQLTWLNITMIECMNFVILMVHLLFYHTSHKGTFHLLFLDNPCDIMILNVNQEGQNSISFVFYLLVSLLWPYLFCFLVSR